MDPKDFTLKQAPEGYKNDEQVAANKLAQSLEEYEEIKQQLLKNITTQGGLLSLYLTIVVDVDAGLRYVDELGTPGSWAPKTKEGREKELMKSPSPLSILSTIPGRIGDIYRQALLQKRLLIPVALAAAISACNTALPDAPVHPKLGFALVGFLTYKTSALTWLWENDLKPDLIDSITGKKEQEAQLARRPTLEKVPDAEEVLAAKGKTMDN